MTTNMFFGEIPQSNMEGINILRLLEEKCRLEFTKYFIFLPFYLTEVVFLDERDLFLKPVLNDFLWFV